MLNRILDFIEGAYVYCPRCLTRLPIRSRIDRDIPCEECQFMIPQAYIRECKNAPPVFVQLFGLPSVGKTTFLDILRLHLYDMDQAWGSSKFYAEPVTQLDMDHKTILLTERARGIMPGSTPKRSRDQNEVYIMDLEHMTRWGSRFLVLMDHSGEQFGKLVVDVEEIPFLQHTPVTILLLSLPDLAREGKRVNDLITSYITSLESYGVNFQRERRQLIIVFSKADSITNLPSDLRDYLAKDTIYSSLRNQQRNLELSSEAEMEDYIRQMGIISNRIRTWVEKEVPGGAAMLHMLDDKGIAARFTVMSALGHTPSGSRQGLAPTPRRVLDPFFWVLEYYKHLRLQDIVQARLDTILATFSPALRSIGSLVLLALLLLCTFEGGLYAIHLSHGSPEFADFCLLLVLLFICTLINQRMSKPDPVARSTLNTTRLALFVSCVALQTLPSVQQALSQITLYQFLGILIAGMALFSCFQPAARLTTQSRITLAAIAGIGALLQYAYGAGQELPMLPFMTPGTYVVTNDLLLMILVAGAVILPLLSTQERIWLDWTALFVLALVYSAFQFVYGSQEILQALPFLSSGSAVFLNWVLVFIVVVALPLSRFFLHRFAHIDCLPLLIIAVVCAGMINFLGSGVTLSIGSTISPVLASTIMNFLMPDQIVGYGLVAANLLIGIRFLFDSRFPEKFAFWDYVALFFIAVVCAQLQVFPWESPAPSRNLHALQIALFTANQVVSIILILLIFAGSAAALGVLLLPLARQFKQIEEIVQATSGHIVWLTRSPVWFVRVMTFVTAIGCAFLVALYSPIGSLLPQIFSDQALSTNGFAIFLYLSVSLLFVVFAITSLRQLTRPFRRVDRFLLLMNIVFCTAFYFVKAAPLLPLSLTLQSWNEDAHHSLVPDLLFACLVICMAVALFYWVRRRKFSGDRRLLQIISGLALSGGLVQLIVPSPFFTLLALLALIMGVIIAAISASSTV